MSNEAAPSPAWVAPLRNELRRAVRRRDNPLFVRYAAIQQMKRERWRARVALLLPPWPRRHDRRLEHVRAMSAAITAARDLLESEISQLIEDHGAALRALDEWATSFSPFVLALGNFALQADALLGLPSPSWTAESRVPGIAKVFRPKFFTSYSTPTGPGLATQLAAALDGRAYVVTVTNVAAITVERTRNLGRLVLPAAQWLPFVVRLAGGASMVVVDLASPTLGVQKELEALVDPNLAKRTVIVSADPERLKLAEKLNAAMRSLAELPPQEDRLVPPDDALLAPFARKVVETDIDFNDLDVTPEMRDLLERIDQLNAMPPEARRKRLRADELMQQYQHLMDTGELDEAFETVIELKQLHADVGGTYRVVEADFALGLVEFQRGDQPAALARWRNALDGLGDLDADERLQLMANYQIMLGAIYQLGDAADRARLEQLGGETT